MCAAWQLFHTDFSLTLHQVTSRGGILLMILLFLVAYLMFIGVPVSVRQRSPVNSAQGLSNYRVGPPAKPNTWLRPHTNHKPLPSGRLTIDDAGGSARIPGNEDQIDREQPMAAVEPLPPLAYTIHHATKKKKKPSIYEYLTT